MWFKTFSDFAHHPKVLRLMERNPKSYFKSLTLWQFGQCHTKKWLTDGFIANHYLPCLLPHTKHVKRYAEMLVDVGLWERCEGGYRYVNYTTYQESREKVEQRRECTAERVADLRRKKRDAKIVQIPHGDPHGDPCGETRTQRNQALTEDVTALRDRDIYYYNNINMQDPKKAESHNEKMPLGEIVASVLHRPPGAVMDPKDTIETLQQLSIWATKHDWSPLNATQEDTAMRLLPITPNELQIAYERAEASNRAKGHAGNLGLAMAIIRGNRRGNDKGKSTTAVTTDAKRYQFPAAELNKEDDREPSTAQEIEEGRRAREDFWSRNVEIKINPQYLPGVRRIA